MNINGPLTKVSDQDMFMNFPKYRDLKMVLVCNNELKMGKGKLGA